MQQCVVFMVHHTFVACRYIQQNGCRRVSLAQANDCEFPFHFLHSSIGGTPIKDDTCVCDRLFNSPTTWAATFHLRGFHLVYAVFLCDHNSGCDCETYSFTTDGCRVFNVHRNISMWCMPYTRRGFRHEQVCTRVDSEGQRH